MILTTAGIGSAATWDAIDDGGFEFGGTATPWTTFSTYIDNLVIWYDPGIAHSGSFVAKLGTPMSDSGFNLVAQEVALGAGGAELRFWLWVPEVSGHGTDVMTVLVDNQTVWTLPEALAGPYASGYRQVALDLGAFADGGSHSLTLKGETTYFIGGSVATAFLVDDVELPTWDEALGAAFAWAPWNPYPGTVIQFVDSSPGGPDGWVWDFGDGGESTLQHPTHAYATAGTFAVTLTTTNLQETATVTHDVRVYEVLDALTADFAWQPEMPFAGQELELLDRSPGQPDTWLWEFPDGTTSDAQNPVVAPAEPGMWPVLLTVYRTTDLGGTETDSIERSIPVLPVLEPDFDWRPETPVEGEPVEFTDMTVGPVESWRWTFGDGAEDTTPDPVHTYDQPGSYDVELEVGYPVADELLTWSVARTIVIGEALAPDFSWQPEMPRVGDPIQFTDLTPGDVASWQWNFGDDSSTAAQNPVHSYGASGRYQVTLQVTAPSGHSSIATNTVVVGDPLEAAFMWQPRLPRAREPVYFRDRSSGGPTAWSWDFGDGGTSDAQNPGRVFGEPGVYQVTLNVATDDGETSTIGQTLEVAPLIDARFGWLPAVPAPGQMVQFADRSVGPVASWSWDFGDGATSSDPSPTHRFVEAGQYLVELQVATADGVQDTATRTMVVATSLGVDFDWLPAEPEAGQIIRFRDRTTIPEVSRLWIFGDAITSRDENPVRSFRTVGEIPVTLVVRTPTGGILRIQKIVPIAEPSVRPSLAVTTRQPILGQEVGFRIEGVEDYDAAVWDFGGAGCGDAPRVRICAPDDGDCLESMWRFAAPGIRTVRAFVDVEGRLYGPIVQQLRVGSEGGCGEAPVADFSWWPEQPAPGESVRFVDQSSGPPQAWSWDLGDGTTTTDRHPEHVYQAPGTYTVTLAATNVHGASDPVSQDIAVSGAAPVCGDGTCQDTESSWSCPSDCGLLEGETGREGSAQRRSVIPAAVGGIPGNSGTTWYTDGMLFNPTAQDVDYVLRYSPDSNPAHAKAAGPFTIGPRESLYYRNLISDLFGVTANGALWLDAAGPLMFDTRTYNLSPDGTYGQAISAIPPNALLARGDGPMYLIGLSDDEAFRSNLIVQEVSGQPVSVDVTFFDLVGHQVGRGSILVEGRSKVQRRITEIGVQRLARGYATVEVADGGGRIAVIASVVDQITGDATTIDAVHPFQVETAATKTRAADDGHFLVAVVARTPGSSGSLWRSELSVLNPEEVEQDLVLRYYPTSGGVFEAPVTVGPSAMYFSDDVVSDLFPEAPNGSGSLHVFSSAGVVVSSRTYNLTNANTATLGQNIPGLAAADMARPGEVWVLNKIKNTDDFRCNLGFSEYAGAQAQVTVALYSMAGSYQRFLGAKTYPVSAFGVKQVNRVFDDIGIAGSYEEALAYVVVSSDDGAAYVYASVVDNGVGDATTVLAKRLE
jgi:PKD repeat protein